MRKRTLALVLLIVSALTVSVCAALQAQQQRMSEKIIRLHVVANSDSSADQAIKLHVRDAVLAAARQALQGAGDPQQAIAQALPQLEAAATAALILLSKNQNVRSFKLAALGAALGAVSVIASLIYGSADTLAFAAAVLAAVGVGLSLNIENE